MVILGRRALLNASYVKDRTSVRFLILGIALITRGLECHHITGEAGRPIGSYDTQPLADFLTRRGIISEILTI